MKTKQILIVEDDMTLAHSIAFTLKRYRYAVTSMSRARQAFKAITTLKGMKEIDLLITDIQLPDMSGRELIDKLVKCDSLPLTIVMTAYASNDLFNELRNKGVRACLAKPFDIKVLIDIVSTLLDENFKNKDH